MPPRKVNEKVQTYYDALSDDDKADLDRRLLDSRRTLADMRLTAKGTLDQRLLIPKMLVPNKQTTPDLFEGDDKKSETKDESSSTFKPGDKLPDGMDLGTYIKQQTGDGKALADFYLRLLQLTPRQARKEGVYMNHRIQGATWLGERGFGKVRGDEEKSSTTINIIDFKNADVADKPHIITIETKDPEAHVGKDMPALMTPDPVEVQKYGHVPDVEDFDLSVEDVK